MPGAWPVKETLDRRWHPFLLVRFERPCRELAVQGVKGCSAQNAAAE